MNQTWRKRLLFPMVLIALAGIVYVLGEMLVVAPMVRYLERRKAFRDCAPLPALGAEPHSFWYARKQEWEFRCANPEEVTDVTVASWIPHLKRLQATFLHLDRSRITDETLMCLQTVESLTGLSIRGTKISDEGLKSVGQMKNLRRLYAPDTPITDDGLAYLVDLPRLQIIDLSGTRVTQEAIDEFSLARPNVEMCLGSPLTWCRVCFVPGLPTTAFEESQQLIPRFKTPRSRGRRGS